MVPTRSSRIRRVPALAALGVLWVALSPPFCPESWGVSPVGASLGAQEPADARRQADGSDGSTATSEAAVEPLSTPSNRRAGQVLLVCGLPGDEAHAEAFAKLRGRWIAWLTGPAGFSPQQVTVFSGKTQGFSGKTQGDAAGAASGTVNAPRMLPATREQLEQTGREVVERLEGEDRLWVLLLGHANHDGERAYFHLPGPDVDDRMLGLLFERAGCAEQVFWLTNSCAGWFVDRLSKPGRIVIAATAADNEYNETEFPEALARAMQRPAAELDREGDGWVSVADLFAATVDQVTAIFAADERAATEHAQLDDNGDRRGTELPELAGNKPLPVEPAQPTSPGTSNGQANERANARPGGQPPIGGAAALPPVEPLPGTQPADTPPPRRPEDGLQAARTRIYQVPAPADPPTPAASRTPGPTTPGARAADGATPELTPESLKPERPIESARAEEQP
jgi:hypothetical protein